MVGSDGPVDSVVDTCLSAGGVQGLVVSLLVVGAGEPVGYSVEVAGHGAGSQLGGGRHLH